MKVALKEIKDKMNILFYRASYIINISLEVLKIRIDSRRNITYLTFSSLVGIV